MFAEVKAMLQNRISGESYNKQIAYWIKAAVLDLTKTDQIVLDGVCDISVTENQDGTVTITDNSTIEDEFVFATCAAYVSMNIGNPPNYDNLSQAYNTMKGNMRMSKVYKAAPEEAET